jgi:hypothetical protein
VPYPYDEVHVLMTRFEDASPADIVNMERLEHVLTWDYQWNVLHYKIPLHNSQKDLWDHMKLFKRHYGAPRNLLVVVYTGHGNVGEAFKMTEKAMILASESKRPS